MKLWRKGQTDWTPNGSVVSLEFNFPSEGFEVKVEDFPEVQPAFLRCWLMNLWIYEVFFLRRSTFACISKMNEGTGGSKKYVTHSWSFEQSLSERLRILLKGTFGPKNWHWRDLRSKECLRLVISRYLLEYGADSDLWHHCICGCHEGHWARAAGGDFLCPAWCGHSSAYFSVSFCLASFFFSEDHMFSFPKNPRSTFRCRLLLSKRVHTKRVVFFPNRLVFFFLKCFRLKLTCWPVDSSCQM